MERKSLRRPKHSMSEVVEPEEEEEDYKSLHPKGNDIQNYFCQILTCHNQSIFFFDNEKQRFILT
jgi:hypothetical protein